MNDLQPSANEELTERAPIQERGTNGRFVAGNQCSVTHGAYRSLDRPDLRMLIGQERAAVIAALGGTEAVSPQMSSVVDSYAENFVLRAAALTRMIDVGGMVTSKGRVRAIFKVWQQLDEAMVRRALVLGLERRTKSVRDMSVDEYLARERQQVAGDIHGAR